MPSDLWGFATMTCDKHKLRGMVHFFHRPRQKHFRDFCVCQMQHQITATLSLAKYVSMNKIRIYGHDCLDCDRPHSSLATSAVPSNKTKGRGRQKSKSTRWLEITSTCKSVILEIRWDKPASESITPMRNRTADQPSGPNFNCKPPCISSNVRAQV